MVEKEIQKARSEIDKVDEKISELIEKRVEITERVIRIKKEKGLDIEDSARENEIIHKVTSGRKSKELIEKIYRQIFSWVKDR